MMEAAVGAIGGVIAIVIFAAIYAGLNTSQVSSSATSLLDLVDLLLSAGILLGILFLVFRAIRV